MFTKFTSAKNMTKEIVKKEEIKPEKKYGVTDAKDFIIHSTKASSDPNENLARFAQTYLADAYKGTLDKKTEEGMLKSIGELSMTFSQETGYVLMNSLASDYHGLAFQMKKDLQQEFNCIKPSEKALVDIIVNAYVRKLTYSNKMERNQKYLGSEQDGYRNYLSKELDRAHRQFLSALETLKAIQQPAMNVNIKTNTAFVGENQQFNTKVENNEAK